MFLIKICFILITAISLSWASDPFISFLQQVGPCFEAFEIETCDTPLYDVFTPSFKGSDTAVPNTLFWLFTPENPEKAEPLHSCGGKLPENSLFNSTLNTVFVIHGVFESLCRVAIFREFKEQLLIRGGYNVILVDWSWGNTLDPAATVVNSYVVGEQTGFVIRNIMMQNNYTDGSKFHIISHSAGAYAANTAAKFIIDWSSVHKLRRNTLLDPASLRLREGYLARNTSYKGAHFVDVYHTNGAECFEAVTDSVASLIPNGHADFYPNGGYLQLSCYFQALINILKGDLLFALAHVTPALCSHLQAVEYFKVSITHPTGFHIGVECDSYEDFLSGNCKRCCKGDSSSCAVAGMDAEYYFPHLGEPRKVRKYYYSLGLLCPYNEDYDLINKDC